MNKARFAPFSFSVFCIPCFALAAEPQCISIDQLGKSYQLVGRLQAPLGDVIEVEGVVVEGPSKGYEDGPNLRPQRIKGVATQRAVQIPLSPYFNDWGKEASAGGIALPKLEMGRTYRFEGYETGGYVGIPGEAFQRAGIVLQTTGHYFRTHFVVYKAKRIEPIRLTPADFHGSHALMQGTAHTRNSQAVVDGEGWSVLVDPKAGWPAHVEGKLTETYGIYNPLERATSRPAKQERFALLDGEWRLVRLEDQLGRDVVLRGRAVSTNGYWWFHYRGVDLYVENMDQVPGWSTDNHWRAMVIRGRLEKAKLPRIDQVTLKPERDVKEYFIVRNASWKPLPELLSPERPIDEEE